LCVCLAAGCQGQRGHGDAGPVMGGPQARGAVVGAPPAPASTAGAAVAGVSTCEACVDQGGAFCTKPRACLSPADGCGGLVLRDRNACANAAVAQPDSLESLTVPYGAPVTANMQDFPGVRLTLAENHCYVLRYALGPASTGSYVRALYKLVSAQGTRSAQIAGYLRDDESGQSEPICIQQGGALDFYFVGSDEYALVRNIGSGTLTFWVLQGPADLVSRMKPPPGAVEQDADDPLASVKRPPAPAPCAPTSITVFDDGSGPASNPRCPYECRRDHYSCQGSCGHGSSSAGDVHDLCDKMCDLALKTCLKGC
jgi:hypothetical protein